MRVRRVGAGSGNGGGDVVCESGIIKIDRVVLRASQKKPHLCSHLHNF